MSGKVLMYPLDAPYAGATHVLDQELLLVDGWIVNRVPVFVETEKLERPRRTAVRAPYVFRCPFH